MENYNGIAISKNDKEFVVAFDVMKQGIEAYESKHGKVKKIRSKEIHEVM